MKAKYFMILGLAMVPLAACEETSGPSDGDVRVYMARSGLVATGSSSAEMSSVLSGPIPLTAVDSINIRLTSIQAFNSSDSTGAVTIDLEGEGESTFNLLDLPSLSQDSTLIARGDLPAGTYNNIRLRFSTATITLNQSVTVGNSVYAAGTHELIIPSGANNGIKVQGASFTIADDSDASVTLSFEPGVNVANIVATGANKLMMSPVLHVRANVESDD